MVPDLLQMCFSYVGLAVVGTAPDMEVLCFGVCGGCGQRADRERKMLMGQVSELKNEVARKVQTLSFAVQRMSHTHGCSNQLLSGGLRVGCIVSGCCKDSVQRRHVEALRSQDDCHEHQGRRPHFRTRAVVIRIRRRRWGVRSR